MSFSGKLWRAATELFESRMRLASRGLVTTVISDTCCVEEQRNVDYKDLLVYTVCLTV